LSRVDDGAVREVLHELRGNCCQIAHVHPPHSAPRLVAQGGGSRVRVRGSELGSVFGVVFELGSGLGLGLMCPFGSA
jgi:hypothetical protein